MPNIRRSALGAIVFAVASLSLAACSTMDGMNHPPAQADQNPAHQMHYPQN